MEVFSKKATPTDINFKFSVPVKAWRFFGQVGDRAVVLRVRDNTGHVNVIRCIIRRQGHPKPVFSAGWRDFVRRKDVKVGDKIIFLLEEDHATGVHYKIEVTRSTKIFGAEVFRYV